MMNLENRYNKTKFRKYGSSRRSFIIYRSYYKTILTNWVVQLTKYQAETGVTLNVPYK